MIFIEEKTIRTQIERHEIRILYAFFLLSRRYSLFYFIFNNAFPYNIFTSWWKHLIKLNSIVFNKGARKRFFSFLIYLVACLQCVCCLYHVLQSVNLVIHLYIRHFDGDLVAGVAIMHSTFFLFFSFHISKKIQSNNQSNE